MPLAAGTALQNGHYVVDALLEEAANGDLYWGTHIATGLSVYLQQLTPAAQDLDPAVQPCLQALAFAPQPPLPQPLQFFVDGDYGYLAMGTHLGQPWSWLGQRRSPATPKAALALVRQAAAGVAWLLQQGLPTVDLSPNRLWLPGATGGDTPLILTGLTTPRGDGAPPLAHPVRGLAAFLYSLLAGQGGDTAELDTWVATLRQQRPQLSPLILQAIEAGLKAEATGGDDLLQALDSWLQMLPDADRALATTAQPDPLVAPATAAPELPSPAPAVEAENPAPVEAIGLVAAADADAPSEPAVAPTVAVAPEPAPTEAVETLPVAAGALAVTAQTAIVPVPKTVKPPRSPKGRLIPALALTAVVAAIAGVGAGAAWRLAPSGLPGQVRLDPNQSFPPQPDWSGDQPDAGFDRPYLPEGDLDRPPIPEPAWEQSPLPTADPWAIDDPWAPTTAPDPWDPQYGEPESPPATRPTPADVTTPNRPPVDDRPVAPTPAPEPSPSGRTAPAPAPAEPAPAPAPAATPEGAAES